MGSLQALWRRRDLVHTLASSDFKSRYRRLGLGLIWAVVTPVVQGLLISVVFSIIGRGAGVLPFPYALYVLSGIMPWGFFTAAMLSGARSILDSAQIVQRVRLPRSALPTATIMANVYNLAIMLAVLLVIVLAFAPGRLAQIWILPAPVALIVLFSYGLALTLSTLQVRYRDIEPLLNTAVMAWFWVTPIIYLLADDRLAAHPVVLNVIRMNPMTGILGLFRAAYLGMAVDTWATVASMAWTAFFLVLGWNVFVRRESTVADFI